MRPRTLPVLAALAAAILATAARPAGPPDLGWHVRALAAEADRCEGKEDFAAALPLRRRALEAARRAYGKDDWHATDARLALAHAERLARLDAAELFQLAAAQTCHVRAISLKKQRKVAAAIAAATDALRLRVEILGDSDPDSIDALYTLGWYRRDAGEYALAEPLLRRTLELGRRVFGERHPHYGLSLNTLGWVYAARREYARAEPLFREAERVYLATQGDGHPGHVTSMNNLGLLYERKGDYAAARPWFERVLEARKRSVGEKHADYAATLQNLATVYRWMGEYRLSLPLREQALEIYREVRGEKSLQYAWSLNNLAAVHREMGDYKRAIPLFKRSLAIFKEVVGEKHYAYGTNLNNLAFLYQEMGDYKAALPLFEKALEVFRGSLGEKDPEYATTLNNLGMVHEGLGKLPEALRTFQRALELRKACLGEGHWQYAVTLRCLARVRAKMGEIAAALPLQEQAVRVTGASLGQKHPTYAVNLNELGSLHRKQHEFDKALPLDRRALEVLEGSLGRRHPKYADSLLQLATTRLGLGQADEARRLSEAAIAIDHANLRDSGAALSERQQLAAAAAVRSHLEFRLSVPDPDAAAYAHVLAAKGAVFQMQRRRRALARLLADSRPGLPEKAERLQRIARELTALAVAAFDPKAAAARRARMEELTRQKEEIEGELAALSDGLRGDGPSVEALAKALPADVALVDYLVYNRFDPAQKDPAKRYQRRLTAFVVRRGSPVARLDLGPADAVESAAASALAGWKRPAGPRRDEATAAEALRRLVWLPLRKHVAGAKTVLVSPDGALAGVPFAALPGEAAGSYLLEDIALAVVPVPQALPEMLAPVAKAARHKPSLLVVGDVDFELTETAVASADERSAPAGSLRAWRKLPATAAEASAVKDTFARLFKAGTVADLREGEARKAAVRDALSKARYAHLATHGFFAPPALRSALAGGDGGLFGGEGAAGWHPLLLSGVVLAGANREAKPGEEDGILTALEVSELDLSRLELAVLSACETGLGRQAGGEGVLGLQRAFAVAGCRGVVASLWEVDDRATQELMVGFYKAYWDPKKIVPRAEALRRAQLAMLREGGARAALREGPAKEPGRTPPYYWAAFVLSGDWR